MGDSSPGTSAGYHWIVEATAEDRERRARDDLRAALRGLDTPILSGMARALERDRDRLVGGTWGIDDRDGCLLTLAARELGDADGEELLRSSIAAVRVPALFDELWATVLARTGDTGAARRITQRLVREALADRADQGDGEAPPGAPSRAVALSARPR